MYKDFYQKDKGKRVSVAIQHREDPNAVFWLHGELLEVRDNGLIITVPGGFRLIPYSEIMGYHLDRKAGMFTNGTY